MCSSTSAIRADALSFGIDALATFTFGRVYDIWAKPQLQILPSATVVLGYRKRLTESQERRRMGYRAMVFSELGTGLNFIRLVEIRDSTHGLGPPISNPPRNNFAQSVFVK
jgi:hypothetical protein